MEVLFNTNALTDVGCTYKLFKKSALKKLEPLWRTRNSLFATELVLLTISENTNFIEIPVTFKKRIGISTFTDKWYKLAKWGIHIELYILSFWLQWIGKITIKKLQK